MSSIGSMTGHSRVAQGPSIVVTSRGDLEDTRKLMPPSVPLKETDIIKQEIVVSAKHKAARTHAYSQVSSKDLSEATDDSMRFEKLDSSLCCDQRVVDLSFETYNRDLYDSRTEFELFLNKYQISFVTDATDQNMPDLLLNCQMKLKGSVFSKSLENKEDQVRRNVIFFDLNPDKFDGIDAKKKYTIVTKNENGKLVPLFQNDVFTVVTTSNCNVFYFNTEGLTLQKSTSLLKRLFNYVFIDGATSLYRPENGDIEEDTADYAVAPNIPKVWSPKSKTFINPTEYYFHGISLTNSHMDVRDGDNALAVLRSGAQTIRNGPFAICSGDQVIWLRRSDLICFSADGSRKVRPVLNKVEEVVELGSKTLADDDMRTKFIIRSSNCIAHWEKNETQYKPNVTGDKTTRFPVYVPAPFRDRFNTLTNTTSVLDGKRRRMGSSISNAGPNAIVDLMIGSDI